MTGESHTKTLRGFEDGLRGMMERRCGSRIDVAAMAHAIRWTRERSDPAEPWSGNARLAAWAAERRRRTCKRCGRLRGARAVGDHCGAGTVYAAVGCLGP